MKLNWYPGHIAKAKKTIKENIKLVDIVLEVRDARIPESSMPEAIDDVTFNKAKIIVLNKKDLASENITLKWENYYKNLGYHVMGFSKDDKKDVEKLFGLINNFSSKSKILKLMIVGIPNVGKSTVLNQISRKKTARTGAAPGITRGKQWYKFKNRIHLLDTPGILLPEYDDLEVGYKLAVCEAIDINYFQLEEVAKWLFDNLKELLPEGLKERYKLEELPEFHFFLEEIGRKRGALAKGGEVDLEKASHVFIKDFNNGKLGKVSLEKV